MHTIVAPALRTFVELSTKAFYEQRKEKWQSQESGQYLLNDHESGFVFHYDSVNGNQGKVANEKNYCIKDHHDFAKLYLKPNMVQFTTLTEPSCDVSSLLTIMAESSAFTKEQQRSSKDVMHNVRNPWLECRMTEWDVNKYSKCFIFMSSLVEKLLLEEKKKKEVADALNNCDKRGKSFEIKCKSKHFRGMGGGTLPIKLLFFRFPTPVCHKLRSRDPFYGGRERTRPVSRRGYHLFMLSPPLKISLSETGLGTRKGNI